MEDNDKVIDLVCCRCTTILLPTYREFDACPAVRLHVTAYLCTYLLCR